MSTYLYIYMFIYLETGPHYVSQVGLNLKLNCLCLLIVGIKTVHHHSPLHWYFEKTCLNEKPRKTVQWTWFTRLSLQSLFQGLSPLLSASLHLSVIYLLEKISQVSSLDLTECNFSSTNRVMWHALNLKVVDDVMPHSGISQVICGLPQYK